MSNTPAFPKEPPVGYPQPGFTPNGSPATDDLSDFERDPSSHDTDFSEGSETELQFHAKDDGFPPGSAGERLKSEASKKAAKLGQSAEDAASRVKEKATEQWETASDRAKELKVTAEDYIRQNPTKTVVIAAVTGLLLGLTMRR